jgi:hypothetical protein
MLGPVVARLVSTDAAVTRQLRWPAQLAMQLLL